MALWKEPRGVGIFPSSGHRTPDFPDQTGTGMDAKFAAQAKNHSQIERRRRERINFQLNILRQMLPQAAKVDKASLLAEAIDRVKSLENQVQSVKDTKTTIMAEEIDSVSVESLATTENEAVSTSEELLRATISCEDKPEFLPALIAAIKEMRLEIVKSKMAAVGSRVKHELILRQLGIGDQRPVEAIVDAIKRIMDPHEIRNLEAIPISQGGKRMRLSQLEASQSNS